MHTSPPSPSEYAPYFNRYVSLVSQADFAPALASQPALFREHLGKLSAEQAGYRYALGKWSIRQVVGHVVDSERVFAYRALCIARGETASLPSFDENAYASLAEHERSPLAFLLDELALTRQSNLFLFEHLSQSAWERSGTVNQNPISVRTLAYIIVGHAKHHANILRDRYGVAFPSAG